MKNPGSMGPTVSRRTFLTTATALPAASLIKSAQSGGGHDDSPWYSTLRRCGQINYNEIDPIKIDPEAWMDYWASLKVNAVLVNGGGIVAFYPTQVPYHHRSQYLGSRDLLGEMVAAGKKRGFRMIARMDCNLAYQEALDARPEWFERNRDGSPRPHAECPWLYKTCTFSTYFSEQMPAIYREINEHYSVDGFFTNGWPSTGALGMCYCESCQKLYRQEAGGIPPETADPASLIYRRYYAAYMDRVLEIWKLWQSVAQEKRQDAVYVGNLGGGIETVKSVKRLADGAAWFNADHQGRIPAAPVWNCAQQGRVARSVMNGRTVTNVTGAYAVGRPTWRHTAQSQAELKMWLAQVAASGMVPWFHWLGGSPEDNRWRNVGRDFFTWHAANEAHFRNRRSVADIAVLYPQSTIAFYRRGGGHDPLVTGSEHLQGLYYALIEGRFLFDLVHQENLSAQALATYRALLIPNAAFLRDSECEVIRQYVKSGGALLATHETSRYSEWGDPRQELGLSDVLGVSLAGDVVGPHGNSYMRIEQRHEVTAGFDGTNIIPNAEYRLPVRAHASSQPILTVVPSFPVFPPEMVYPRAPHTDEPAAIFMETAGSRTAYFAGDVDRTFWNSGNDDLCRVLHNAIRWLRHGDSGPVSVKGHGLVEIFAWETDPGYALHILNYTNPNALRAPCRHVHPVGAQEVVFRTARRISKVQALRSGISLSFQQNEDNVAFTVPRVEDYEVVALV